MTDSKKCDDGCLIAPLSIRHPTKMYDAQCYHFLFEHFGWATFIICDDLGELSVQSDWGCWGHRWNPDHLGPSHGGSLTHFLAHSDRHYIANKLSYSMPPNDRELPDIDKTEREMKKTVLLARRRREIDADVAQELYEDIERCCSAYEGGMDSAYLAMSDDLSKFLEDSWEYFETRENPNLVILRERLIPWLQKELREQQKSKASA